MVLVPNPQMPRLVATVPLDRTMRDEMDSGRTEGPVAQPLLERGNLLKSMCRDTKGYPSQRSAMKSLRRQVVCRQRGPRVEFQRGDSRLRSIQILVRIRIQSIYARARIDSKSIVHSHRAAM